MTLLLALPLAGLIGYLIGGIVFAVWVSKARGVDIYSVGSGNPGTSNVLRTLGKGAAAAVLAGDLLKGTLAGYIGFLIDGQMKHAAIVGLAALVGHCFPLVHKFKGGKGVATFFGVVLFVHWPSFLILAAVWLGVIGLTRKASLASLTVVLAALPVLWFGVAPETVTFYWLLAGLVLVVIRHAGSIKRLVSGEERSIERDSNAPA